MPAGFIHSFIRYSFLEMKGGPFGFFSTSLFFFIHFVLAHARTSYATVYLIRPLPLLFLLSFFVVVVVIIITIVVAPACRTTAPSLYLASLWDLL